MFRAGEFIDERYRVVRELGSGAYGVVYLAEEVDRFTILNSDSETILRNVAVKVVDRYDMERKRFAAEVRALCRLNHPGIVKVFGYGVTLVDSTMQSDRAGIPWPDDNPTRPYLAMEYVEGRPLSDVSGPEALANLARYVGTFIHVAEALGHAHSRGVIHRDLKPHNILVSEDDVPRVVDFGLSWLAKNDEGASRRLGTPGYMAPELIENDAPDADHRADIYSFGATIYRLFTGRTPFQARGVMATIHAQISGEFEFPDEFPTALLSLVSRCLHKDPLNRPRSAAIVAEELRHIALAPGLFESKSSGDASTLDGYTELPERADVRDARISELEPFDHPTRGRGLKFAAFTGSSDEAQAARGFLYAGKENSASRRVFNVLQSAWEGAELSIYNAKPIQDSAGRRFLAADGSTVPVLEPYFPVSVTDVATAEGVRCGACASRVLVDLRAKRDWGVNLVLGSIAHDMLEDLVREEKSLEEFDQLFDDNLAARRTDAVAARIKDADLPKIRIQLRAHFENLRRWVEPTRAAKLAEVKRYSSRYGLEGRIDLALVDENVTQIIELKTGSFESAQHERQLRCYTLLWDAIAQRNGRTVEGRLLYSKTGKLKPLSRRDHESEREVLIARNDVVAMHRYYSDGDTSYRPLAYGDDPQKCADYPCKFRRKECEKQKAFLGNFRGKEVGLEEIDRAVWGEDIDSKLVHATREYYAHFVRLIEREYRSSSRAMGAVFRTATIPKRVAKLRAVDNAVLEQSSRDTRRVLFACKPWGVFDVGDSVVAHRGDFDAEPALTGRVVKRTRESLEISCNGADFATDLPREGWVID
ncbi:MAG: serine/threonine protein kinase, partial [Bradymonadia bacterium]